MELECPVCGEWIDLDDFAVQTDCPDCQTALLVETDGEIIDGIWHTHSKLITRDKPCRSGIDPRDPAYDPEHKWRTKEAPDETTFTTCERCGKESQ